MLVRLILLFVFLPLIELILLLGLSEQVGVPETIGLVLLTGVVGACVARQQGIGALRRIQAATAAGRVPANELVDGFLILVAGLLLITPGLITDAVGFLLLLPSARARMRRVVADAVRRHAAPRAEPRFPHGGIDADTPDNDSGVIDVEARSGEES